MTGAPISKGADSVVRQEDTDMEIWVEINMLCSRATHTSPYSI